jgi:tetratricopeptide (TPR) repeat protein
VNQQDLTAHAWAGLPVTARLVARDATGQAGISADTTFVLPERMFQNPVARALIAIRKGLSLHPEDRDSAVNGLDTLIMQPQLLNKDFGAYVNLSALYYLLEQDKSPKAIDQAQQRMWELALHLEEGQTEQTARALEQARQAARDALNKAMQEPTDANRQALEKRLEELQKAIERHMEALLEDAQRNHEELPFDPESQHLSNRDFERMAEAARQAAQEGRMDDAQRRMAELERMLDRLRNARAEHGKAGQQRAQQRQRGRQQMGALQDMIGRQGGLLDHAQGRVDADTRPRLGHAPPSEPADPNAEREADRRVQQALRRALGELMQQFSDLSGELPPSLGEADKAMREAGRNLGSADDKGAGGAEQRAIEALQKGGREMGQAMARQFGTGQQGAEGEGEDGSAEGQLMMQEGRGDGTGTGTLPGAPGRADGRRDPLGRHYGQGTSGADEGDDVTVPEERERQRTRAIEEELRRRDANRERPQEELDYLGRLLKGF